MKTFQLLSALFCLTLFTLPAPTARADGAEKLTPKEPIVELNPPEEWTGFYIGGNIGGAFANYEFNPFHVVADVGAQFVDVEEFLAAPGFANTDIQRLVSQNQLDNGSEFAPATFTFGGGRNGTGSIDSGTDDSIAGGGQIGYQKQFGHFVVGVEGDFDRASPARWETFSGVSNDSFVLGTIDGIGIAEVTSTTEVTAKRRAQMEWMASARAKLGYARGPVLLYATGGAAFAQVNAWAMDTAKTDFNLVEAFFVGFPIFTSAPIGTVSDTNVSRDSDILTGWTGGGGAEYMLTPCVSIGLEYRHSDFGTETFHFSSHNGRVLSGDTEVDITADQIQFKLNILLSQLFGRHH